MTTAKKVPTKKAGSSSKGTKTNAQKNGFPTGSTIQGTVSLEISFDEICSKLVAGYGKSGTSDGKEEFANLFMRLLKQILKKHEIAEKYNILILFDNTTLVKSDSDRIYQAIKNLSETPKPLLLVLLSNGGEPGSAYLIGKLCRESSNGKFIAAVPRHAKSAATLLACAADEIHMGSLSELGPIDPQINRMPALGLKHSIEHIADLVSKKPDSAQMFARYLYLAVEPIQIGYYERAAKSAEQYAEKLLESHKKNLVDQPQAIAYKLVHEYKDHGFVIDKSEATNIFGSKTIKSNTPEYDLANALYIELSRIEDLADLFGYTFYFIGGRDSTPQLEKKRTR